MPKLSCDRLTHSLIGQDKTTKLDYLILPRCIYSSKSGFSVLLSAGWPFFLTHAHASGHTVTHTTFYTVSRYVSFGLSTNCILFLADADRYVDMPSAYIGKTISVTVIVVYENDLTIIWLYFNVWDILLFQQKRKIFYCVIHSNI